MTERAAPFYCPYCAEEDLRPFGESHGQWRCGACQRAFALKYLGIASDWTAQPDLREASDERLREEQAGHE